MFPLFVILLAICGAVIITFVVFLPVIRIFMIIIDDNGDNDHRDIIDDVANDDQNI